MQVAYMGILTMDGKQFEKLYESIICELSFLSPRLPNGVKTLKQTRMKNTMKQFSFREAKFTTKKDNIVKVQFIPEELEESAIELSFTVNDSFDDRQQLDTEIISGVLGIVLRDVKKYNWDKIFISPKFGKGDIGKNKNRRENVFYTLLDKHLKNYTFKKESSFYKYFKRINK